MRGGLTLHLFPALSFPFLRCLLHPESIPSFELELSCSLLIFFFSHFVMCCSSYCNLFLSSNEKISSYSSSWRYRMVLWIMWKSNYTMEKTWNWWYVCVDPFTPRDPFSLLEPSSPRNPLLVINLLLPFVTSPIPFPGLLACIVADRPGCCTLWRFDQVPPVAFLFSFSCHAIFVCFLWF